MEASKPKWVNSNDIQYGVNSLSLGGLHIVLWKTHAASHAIEVNNIISWQIQYKFNLREKRLDKFYFTRLECQGVKLIKKFKYYERWTKQNNQDNFVKSFIVQDLVE